MKIRSVVALSLTLCSTGTLAFQARPIAGSAVTVAGYNADAFENTLTRNAYLQGAQPQISLTGTCAATPVAGCSCPFCTMLRSHRR